MNDFDLPDSTQRYREEYIKHIDEIEDKTNFIDTYSDSLFALGLTMYSRNYSFESIFYNAFALSELDENISLHPEQLKVLEHIQANKGFVFSAPTSFGKTFVIFEYIARYNPHNVVLVVPTLALVDEYKSKIIKQFKTKFMNYKVYLSIDETKDYNFDGYNIFIVTHDRVVDENIISKFSCIDLLVIDEVYKLQKDESNDRVLILNIAYYNLVKISNKYVLLAPFISGIENLNQLEDVPLFYNTNFSPVVNEVKTYEINHEEERLNYALKIIQSIPLKENMLIYFPTIKNINKFIDEYISTCDYVDYNSNYVLSNFIEWARKEIHEEWNVIKALEKGYFIHNGQLPLGLRLLQLDLFNDYENGFNKMLCTSTLLEGVNTSAKHVIITQAARGSYRESVPFDAFDFYNLVGRTGRLYKHYLGIAHYIRLPDEPNYHKSEALKSIEFELTNPGIDININCNDNVNNPTFVNLINELGITIDEYKQVIGAKFRFGTVKFLFEQYKENKRNLMGEIEILLNDDTKSKLSLIRALCKIFNDIPNYRFYPDTYLINVFTYLVRKTVRQAVEQTRQAFKKSDLNTIISSAIRMKNSYIEYDFYSKTLLVQYFMKCQRVNEKYYNTVHEKLLKNIELMYYMVSPSKEMLKDMGIYDGDIDYIINIIGDDFDTIQQLQERLRMNDEKIKNISIISRYVINSLIL